MDNVFYITYNPQLKKFLKKAKELGLINKIIRQPRKSNIGEGKKNITKRNKTTILTHRESEVCSLAVQDLEFKQIAQILGVAYTTVVEHKKNSYRKLNVHNKKELIQLYNSSEVIKNLLDNVNVCHEQSETVTIISNIH